MVIESASCCAAEDRRFCDLQALLSKPQFLCVRIETLLGEGARRAPRHVSTNWLPTQLHAATQHKNLGVLLQTLSRPDLSFGLGQIDAPVAL